MGFDDLTDDEKQQLLATMKSGQSNDTMIPSEFQNQDNSQPSQVQNSNISTPGDYLKQGFNWYDKNIANRPRAAALAVLQGHSPIQAAIDNQPVSGQDIAREGFKTLNPEITQTTNPSNVLMKQGDALKSAVPAVGFATEMALDPMTYLPGAEEAKFAQQAVEEIPKAEYAAKAFLQKTGPEAESFSSRAEQLDQMNQDMINAEQKANSFKDNPHSPKAQLAMDKFNKLRDKFQKYNQMYQRQRQD